MADDAIPPDGIKGAEGSFPIERAFDFDEHRARAVDAYQKVAGLYADFAQAVRAILDTCLDAERILVNSVEARGKDVESFGRKAALAAEDNPARPKYETPLEEISDLAGARVITFFLDTVDKVDAVIYEQFHVMEKTNKSELLQQEEKLGYQSVHYLVRLADERSKLPEYARFESLIAEIQVRTILQHAWAEIEHDIQYKSVESIPLTVRRRFMALAGLLEIADREFQAITDENEELLQEARKSVAEGRLERVEITPDALKAYLDRKLGPDGRMSLWNYDWHARMLRRMGFTDFEQVNTCIAGYDDDRLSRLLYGNRQGQLTRFEDMLLAGMGENYERLHPWANSDAVWWVNMTRRKLERLRRVGITIGECAPDKTSFEAG